MGRIIKKFLPLLLAGVVVFGSFVACKNKSEPETSETNPPEFNTTGVIPVDNVKSYDSKVIYPETVYEIDESKTFIKNETSEYRILIPTAANANIKNASTVVKKYIMEATGADLPIVEEAEGMTYEKVISLGATNKLLETDIVLTLDELGYLGHKIESIGDNIYLCAYSDKGVLSCAYTFLQYLIGLRLYSADEAIFQEDMVEIPFYKFHLTQTAVTSFIQVHDNPNGVNPALGLGGEHFSWFIQADNQGTVDIWHNVLELFPKSVYLDEKSESYHPEFYNASRSQISYVANGDKDAYNLMVDIAAKSIIETAKLYPDLKRVTITQEDNDDRDTCQAAQEVVAKYGAISALQVLFINDVARQVDVWAKDSNGGKGRQIDVYFFAYQSTVDAPVSEVNGEFVPNAGIYMEDNAGVVIAPIDSDWALSIYDDDNTALLNIFRKWSAISPKIALWAYHFYHSNYFMPYDSYAGVQSIYQAAREFNIEWVYDECRYAGGETTYFTYLYTYLSGRLAWNPDLDVNTEIDLWFNYYFKDAQSYMKQYFDETRVWYQYLRSTYNVSGRIMTVDIDNPVYWPYGLLMRWNSYLTQAYQSIEHYKTENELVYKRLYDRITLETLMIRYMLSEYHASRFSDTELQLFRKEFANDCNRLGILYKTYGTSMSVVFTQWGI